MSHEEIFHELDDCRSSGEFVAYHKLRLRRIVKVRRDWRENDGLRIRRYGLEQGFPSG